MHCGQVKEGVFQDGRKVSVNSVAVLLKLINQKRQADGSVLQKIEKFSEQGVEKGFLKMARKYKKSSPDSMDGEMRKIGFRCYQVLDI